MRPATQQDIEDALKDTPAWVCGYPDEVAEVLLERFTITVREADPETEYLGWNRAASTASPASAWDNKPMPRAGPVTHPGLH